MTEKQTVAEKVARVYGFKLEPYFTGVLTRSMFEANLTGDIEAAIHPLVDALKETTALLDGYSGDEIRDRVKKSYAILARFEGKERSRR